MTTRGSWLDVRGNHTDAPGPHHGSPSECCRKDDPQGSLETPAVNAAGYRRDVEILATDHLDGHEVTAWDITDLATAYGLEWDTVAATWHRVVEQYRQARKEQG